MILFLNRSREVLKCCIEGVVSTRSDEDTQVACAAARAEKFYWIGYAG